MIESQVAYALQCIQAIFDRHLTYLDVKPEAMARFNAQLQEEIGRSVWAAGCRSWYKTATGKVTNNWSGFTVKYRLETWRVTFEDYRMVSGE
jgi:hypothetical protein